MSEEGEETEGWFGVGGDEEYVGGVVGEEEGCGVRRGVCEGEFSLIDVMIFCKFML